MSTDTFTVAIFDAVRTWAKDRDLPELEWSVSDYDGTLIGESIFHSRDCAKDAAQAYANALGLKDVIGDVPGSAEIKWSTPHDDMLLGYWSVSGCTPAGAELLIFAKDATCVAAWV